MNKLLYKKTVENKSIKNNVFVETNKEWESTEGRFDNILESGTKGILFNEIYKQISNASEMICLQSFLIQDTKIIDALVSAIDRNVKVFVMDSAEARLQTSAFEEYTNFSKKDYINMLETKFRNNFVHRQASNLHAKFILIDPKSESSIGYLFTGNFNEKPFIENPELAVKLSKEQTEELFKIFVYHFWEHTTHEQTIKKDFESVKPANKFNFPIVNKILITSPNSEYSNLKKTLIQSIKTAKSKIVFSTFGFDINNDVSSLIFEKLKQGIVVDVYCRPREKAINGNIEKLSKHGATVYCHQLIHAKSLVVDNENGYIFTANFESDGMDSGFEVGVKLNKQQVNTLINIHEKWSATFPYKYKYQEVVSTLNKYSVFNKEGRLDSVNVEETKDQKRKIEIKSVNDLIKGFKINIPQNINVKKNSFDFEGSLRKLDNYNIKEEILKDVSLVEYKKNKKGKIKNYDAIACKVSSINSQEKVEELLLKLNTDIFTDLSIYSID